MQICPLHSSLPREGVADGSTKTPNTGLTGRELAFPAVTQLACASRAPEERRGPPVIHTLCGSEIAAIRQTEL